MFKHTSIVETVQTKSMKSKWPLLLVVLTGVTVSAQSQPSPSLLNSFSAARPATASVTTKGYSVVERGPHHRVWAKVTCLTNTLGRVTIRTNSYTELAAGLHYLAAGQWVESQEVIESVPGGAVARQGQVRVQFANDLATGGAISLETPDGKRLTSHVFGLCYFDAASGTNVLIAGITNCTGRIVSSNQVVYENAFAGLNASVRYTYTRGGFEQDILLHEVPAPPSYYGLNPASTRLVVMTEFLNPPQPVIRQALAQNDRAGMGMEDESLDFGALQIGVGTGFPLGAGSRGVNLSIFKQWAELEGRRFLLEQVPLGDLYKAIDSLPRKEGASLQPDTKAIRFTARSGRLPLPQPRKADPSAMELASHWVPEKSYVLDYATVVGTNNFTFRRDTTYYVSGPVTFTGTATFEGGTVIKFTNSPTAKLSPVSIKCATGPYRMAYLTSKDDDTIGETILGSTGSPSNYNGATFIWSIGLTNLQYMRFSYAGTAVRAYAWNNTVTHCQFVRCGTALNLNTSFMPRFAILNCLFARCGGVIGTSDGYGEFNCQYVTADGGGFDDDPSNQIGLVNCILTDCAPRGVATLYNSVTNAHASEVFQTVGAGNYYLPSESVYHNAGTTNVLPALLEELRQKTTYPPISYSNVVFSQNTVLYPQAQRDTDAPDLGYHYPVLDYLASCCVSNATLALSNGVVVAFNDYVGIWLHNGAQLASCGTPNNRNYLVEYNLVQEQALNLAQPYGIAMAMPINTYHTDPTRNPSISLRFTSEVFAPGTMYAAYTGGGSWEIGSLTLQDYELSAAGAAWYQDSDPASSVITLKNNLFENASIDIWSAGKVICSNNLFVCNGRWLMAINLGAQSYAFSDNGFDNTPVYVDGNLGHNAFLNGSTLEYGDSQQTDVFTNLSWVAGPLGNYYQSTNSPLSNRGSTTANLVGLYHYTTQTNQLKETNSVVDIGYHYVAVDTNGVPFDYDGDGAPDYLEDVNGDGSAVGDPTSWQAYDSPNGLSAGNGLQVFTPLR